jgi:hypothetical protein
VVAVLSALIGVLIICVLAINFLVFTLSALMAPVYGWVLVAVSKGGPLDLPVFQKAGMIGVGGIVLEHF